MLVGEYCNREVVVVDEEKSVAEAAAVMREYHVGDVVICRDERGKRIPVGIITDRDIALEIVAKRIDADSIRVVDAMSFDLTAVSEHDDMMNVIEVMRDKGIRRFPVVDAEKALVGILCCAAATAAWCTRAGSMSSAAPMANCASPGPTAASSTLIHNCPLPAWQACAA